MVCPSPPAGVTGPHHSPPTPSSQLTNRVWVFISLCIYAHACMCPFVYVHDCKIYLDNMYIFIHMHLHLSQTLLYHDFRWYYCHYLLLIDVARMASFTPANVSVTALTFIMKNPYPPASPSLSNHQSPSLLLVHLLQWSRSWPRTYIFPFSFPVLQSRQDGIVLSFFFLR